MKRSEIHDAVREFVADHQQYIADWYGAWEVAVKPLPAEAVITTDGVVHPDWDKLTPEVIADFFNLFWMGLPDSPSIHGPGFYAMCDIAENIFGFEDDED